MFRVNLWLITVLTCGIINNIAFDAGSCTDSVGVRKSAGDLDCLRIPTTDSAAPSPASIKDAAAPSIPSEAGVISFVSMRLAVVFISPWVPCLSETNGPQSDDDRIF